MQVSASESDRDCSPNISLDNNITPASDLTLATQQQLSLDLSPYDVVFASTYTPMNIGLGADSYFPHLKGNREISRPSSHHNIPIQDTVVTSAAPTQMSATHPTTTRTRAPRTVSSSSQYSCADDPFQVDKLCDQSLLHVAVRAGHEDILRLLLQRDGIDIDSRDTLGVTALQLAVCSGQMELVEILLDHGADMNAKLLASPFDSTW